MNTEPAADQAHRPPSAKPFLFSAYLLIFIIHDAQIGVGLPGFQRIIYRSAGHDAWISVILAGLYVHLLAWIIVMTLHRAGDRDLYGIHDAVYGKWLGRCLNLLVVFYYLYACIVVLRNYVEMVQIWLFPYSDAWMLGLIFASLAVYGIHGGLKTIVGASFVFVCLSVWMVILLYFPLVYADWDHLFPVAEADPQHLMLGAVRMSFSLVGFEILYYLYPFVRDKQKVHKYAQLGIMSVNVFYFLVMAVSLVFFSGGQIFKNAWATFTMLKIIQIPFLERFEYLGVSLWLMVIMGNLLLFGWTATRGLKQVFQWKQKYAVVVFFAVVWLVSTRIETRVQMDKINDLFATLSLYTVYLYPLFLFGLVLLRMKSKDGKEETSDEAETVK
ncbi:GerAB/ArcD/ProY family transporter [Paenibacillus gansuensis]|uniref:GerAB/ArcD/ProY family transporter n=1 Tax=Paenibacillus gansuensis TaxID=306542 RepID=A0ABW5PBU2_9BACL